MTHARPVRLRTCAALAALRLVLLVTLPLWLTAVDSRADAPQWAYRTFPFEQRLNMDAVYAVTHSAPEDLLQTIRSHGVDVLRVRSETPGRAANPLLSSLPAVPQELLLQAEFRATHEGRVLLQREGCPGLAGDTILIRDNASAYTLIHEFVQSQLVALPGCTWHADVELRFGAGFRRLTLYQRRLFDDPFLLLDPLWRRDILAAQADVAQLLFARLQMGQSQEAIVEKVLRRYIDERSPYFDEERREQGRRYGEAMIDNAIDLFNTVHDSLAFTREAVRHLLGEIRAGRIAGSVSARLSEADQSAFDAASQEVQTQLELARREILQLKQFYVQ